MDVLTVKKLLKDLETAPTAQSIYKILFHILLWVYKLVIHSGQFGLQLMMNSARQYLEYLIKNLRSKK